MNYPNDSNLEFTSFGSSFNQPPNNEGFQINNSLSLHQSGNADPNSPFIYDSSRRSKKLDLTYDQPQENTMMDLLRSSSSNSINQTSPTGQTTEFNAFDSLQYSLRIPIQSEKRLGNNEEAFEAMQTAPSLQQFDFSRIPNSTQSDTNMLPPFTSNIPTNPILMTSSGEQISESIPLFPKSDEPPLLPASNGYSDIPIPEGISSNGIPDYTNSNVYTNVSVPERIPVYSTPHGVPAYGAPEVVSSLPTSNGVPTFPTPNGMSTIPTPSGMSTLPTPSGMSALPTFNMLPPLPTEIPTVPVFIPNSPDDQLSSPYSNTYSTPGSQFSSPGSNSYYSPGSQFSTPGSNGYYSPGSNGYYSPGSTSSRKSSSYSNRHKQDIEFHTKDGMIIPGIKDRRKHKTGKKWKKDENERLLEAYNQYGENWEKIAEYVGTRTKHQCKAHYTNNLNPNIQKGRWSQEEEEWLRKLHEQYGDDFDKIAEVMGNRIKKQIKQKWVEMNSTKTPWTPEEDAMLLECYAKLGKNEVNETNAYSAIASVLNNRFQTNRTPNTIKTRITSLTKRSRRM